MMVANYEITGEWFRQVEDVVAYIESNGFEVIDSNPEYIEFYDEDDNGYVARLGGAGSTIYIEKITEL